MAIAKPKKNKEKQVSVKDSLMTNKLLWNYDLSKVDTREYAPVLDILFASKEWKELISRRSMLHHRAVKGDVLSFKQIEQVDKKVAVKILNAMYCYAYNKNREENCTNIMLNDYLSDFVRTEEQKTLYGEFSMGLDCAMILADIMESYLDDAKAKLEKLDPTCITLEFKGIKQASQIFKDFTSMHHHDENTELDSLFADIAEEVEDVLRPKVYMYVHKYKEAVQRLEDNGELISKKKKRITDRDFCFQKLLDYFIHFAPADQKKDIKSFEDKARDVVKQFSDEQIPELMNFVVDYCTENERIWMAKKKITSILKSMPVNPTTELITQHILKSPKDA